MFLVFCHLFFQKIHLLGAISYKANCVWYLNIGRAMQKCIFGQMPTAKAQISLHIQAVWSRPLLFANRIFWHIKCINDKQMPRWDFAHVQDKSETLHFAHFWKHLFVWCDKY